MRQSAAQTPVGPGADPRHWLVPEWPLPAGVQALCTTRSGGVSQAPYGAWNLGDHVGDAPAAVAHNRQLLQAVVQAHTPGARAVFLQQVHGCDVLPVGPDAPHAQRADGSVATAVGAVCTVMVADCLPVLLAHASGGVVGAVHAGWRGLAGSQGRGILEVFFERFSHEAVDCQGLPAIDLVAIQAARQPSEWTAWLGPCIGPSAFEVGPEVRAAFMAWSSEADRCFAPKAGGKFFCDLAGLARLRLQALGVTAIYGNDGSADWCTVSQPSRFFSHRRDAVRLGATGRFAACIWRSGA